jgi:hypothetical protein
VCWCGDGLWLLPAAVLAFFWRVFASPCTTNARQAGSREQQQQDCGGWLHICNISCAVVISLQTAALSALWEP